METLATDREPRSYSVSTTKYTYAISTTKDDKEFLSFHWDGKTDPHIHIGFAAKELGALIDKKYHIPSGRVAIEQVVRFLITELGVPERKRNALTFLSESFKAFRKRASW